MILGKNVRLKRQVLSEIKPATSFQHYLIEKQIPAHEPFATEKKRELLKHFARKAQHTELGRDNHTPLLLTLHLFLGKSIPKG